MQIRQEQLAAFEDVTRDEYRYRLIEFLRRELPEETCDLSDAALRERLRTCEQRAARYGITSEAGVAQFACLGFIAGPTFDEIPEVRAFLEDRSIRMTAEEKLDVLVDELAEDEDTE